MSCLHPFKTYNYTYIHIFKFNNNIVVLKIFINVIVGIIYCRKVIL